MLLSCLAKLKGSAPKPNQVQPSENIVLLLETNGANGIGKKPPVKSTENEKKYKDIPKPQKKKHPYSGRVGQKAQTTKRLLNVNTPEPSDEPTAKKTKKEELTIIGEQLPVERILEFDEEYFQVKLAVDPSDVEGIDQDGSEGKDGEEKDENDKTDDGCKDAEDDDNDGTGSKDD